MSSPMSMLTPLSGVLSLFVLSSLLALLLPERLGLRVTTALTALACTLGMGFAGRALLTGDEGQLVALWSLPLGSFHLGLDGLSAFFLFCLFVVSPMAAVYGAGYLRRDLSRRPLRSALVFFPVLIGSMAVVVLARDAILFLIAWEVMSFSSFFLVSFEHQRKEVRRAGFIYLVASQLGAVALFVLFAELAKAAGGFDFQNLVEFGRSADGAASRSPGLYFFLALLGFGTNIC